MVEVREWRELLAVCAGVPVVKQGFGRTHFAAGVVYGGTHQSRWTAWREACEHIAQAMHADNMEEADFAGYGTNVEQLLSAFGIQGKRAVCRWYVEWLNSMRAAVGEDVIVIKAERALSAATDEAALEWTIRIADWLSWENPQSQLCMTAKKLQKLLGKLKKKNLRAQHAFGSSTGSGGEESDEGEDQRSTCSN